MTPIDLRSDTVSKPGPEMRRAMAEAEVGDDVYGDDPTVNRLEAMAAERLGKEAAVYVPSGSMANLVAVMTHTRPGDEIVLGSECHIFNYEVAGAARIANVLTHPLKNREDGSLDVAEVASSFRERGLHTPVTSLLCLENTHNRCGGATIPSADITELASIAHTHGATVHLDGARIFNAAVALHTDAAEIARDCDSVSFCLSKGLGCPVGSLLCGPTDFIEEARRNRKLLGGGMRQTGILAAAGIFALEHHIDRMAEDHANAGRLADGLRQFEGFRPNRPRSNIVVIDLVRGTAGEWLGPLRAAGVLATPFGPRRLRMVTHINITEGDVAEALKRIDQAVAAVAI